MNPASLAIVAGLSIAMLVIFLATGQQWNLTITAVLATGGIAALAVFFYSREEAREDLEDDGYPVQPLESAGVMHGDELPAPAQPDETQTTEND